MSDLNNLYYEEVILSTSKDSIINNPSSRTLEKLDSQKLFVNSNDSWAVNIYHTVGLSSQSSDYFEKLSPEFIELFFSNLLSQMSVQINNIKKLEKNWDEMHAEPFDEEIFGKIEDIIVNIYSQILYNYPEVLIILPKPYLLPNSDGSIDIMWRNSNIYLVINISMDKRIFAAGKSNDSDNINLDSEKDIKNLIGAWLMLAYSKN